MSEHELCEAAKHPVVLRDSRVKVSLRQTCCHSATSAADHPCRCGRIPTPSLQLVLPLSQHVLCWQELGSEYIRRWHSTDYRELKIVLGGAESGVAGAKLRI